MRRRPSSWHKRVGAWAMIMTANWVASPHSTQWPSLPSPCGFPQWQGGAVFDALHCPAFRQEVLKMPSPASRIFPLVVPAHSGPVQDGYDASTDAGCRLGLRRPHRLQHPQDHAHVHRLYRNVVDYRVHVCRQGARPLLGALGISPASSMGCDVSLSSILGGHRCCGFQLDASDLRQLERLWVTFRKSQSSRNCSP